MKAFRKLDLSVREGIRCSVRGDCPGEGEPWGVVAGRGELFCEADSLGEATGLLLPIAAIPRPLPTAAGKGLVGAAGGDETCGLFI